MNLTLEERIDRLTMVINAIDAVKNIPSDDDEDFSTSMIVSEDVPVLIAALRAKENEIPVYASRVLEDQRLRELEAKLAAANDDLGAVSTECQILWELTEDSKVADHLLSDYPMIAFYIASLVDGTQNWQLVYGKKIEVEGVPLGIYYNSRVNSWSVTELESGYAIGGVKEFREAFIRAEMAIKWKGVEQFKNQIAKTLESLTPRPGAPRLIKREGEK